MTSKGDGSATTETVDRILDAAQALFLSEGYAGVNLDRIAKSAGVARQTLYNRFGSKESVFRFMLERHWAKLKSVDMDDLSESEPLSAVAVLTSFATAIVEFVEKTDQVGFIRLVIAESRRLPWIADEFYRAGKEPLLRALVDQLDRLDEAGLIHCRSSNLAAHQFFGLLQESALWPKVMGVDRLVEDVPDASILVEESVATFIARYGLPARG